MKELDKKKIIDNSFYLTFKKGVKIWFLLVVVCFIFSFLGSSARNSTGFVGDIDSLFGLSNQFASRNVETLENYIVNSELLSKVPFISSDIALKVIDFMSNEHRWLVAFLAANFAYFERNTGEVIASLLVASLISLYVKIFIQNAFVIGKHRYFMENRYDKEVKIGRIFAPFHLKNIRNVYYVMFFYNLVLGLWNLTIIGGIYKYYQYRMIPYILAENPSVRWRDARRLSIEMTNGYKWQMFLTELSCFYMRLPELISFTGLLISLPFNASLESELYFTLRDNVAKKNKDIFIEKEFNKEIYKNNKDYEEPKFLLEDVVVSTSKLRSTVKTDIDRLKGEYNIYDYLVFFFSFCFVGYVYEVLLYLVQDHVFVNRGTMYGPWLPIYGVGGVLIVFFLNKYKSNKWKVFGLTMALCAVVEYIGSWILEFFFNSSYWDYEQMFINVNGRICLAGLIAFGLGGLFGIYLAAPRISNFVDRIGKKNVKILCTTLIIFFVIDLVCCAVFGFNTGVSVGGKI